jgi:WD40 repeat protein
MIYYLVNNFDSRFYYYQTCKIVLGSEYRKRVKYISYNQFLKSKKLRSGTYIFSDIERLPPKTAEWAHKYWQELENKGSSIRLLNNPIHVMRRFELLRSLYEKNIHAWNVYRLTDLRWPTRYPVFLRKENDHEGPLTELIHGRSELDNEIKLLTDNGHSREEIIITEFCDTKDSDGIYRKYGAFYLGGKILRRHIFFQDTWMIKYPLLMEEKLLKEEIEYVQSNAHEEEIRKVFDLAHIDHGRIDYAFLDGKIQVWEINTNPYLAGFVGKNEPRNHIHNNFYPEYIKALKEIDLSSDESFRVQVKNPFHSEGLVQVCITLVKKIYKRLAVFVSKRF